MLYDGCMHRRRGKAKTNREVWPFSVSRGRHMLWMPTYMGHAPRAVLRDHYFCRPHPSVLDRNTCSAINFFKKTNGSTTISIAKHSVPRTRACARQPISSRKPMVRQPFRSQNRVNCFTFVCRWHMPVYFPLKKQGSVFQLGRGAWAASPPRETALRITKESILCKPYSCSFCETSELI